MNGTNAFFVPSAFVDKLHFADRRADRRDVQAVFVFQVADFGDFRPRELHHVLHAAADIDEADAVILQAHRGQGGELLHGRFLIGRFVGEGAEDDLGCFNGHDEEIAGVNEPMPWRLQCDTGEPGWYCVTLASWRQAPGRIW